MSRKPEPTDEQIEQALRASRTLQDAPEGLIERAIGLWPAAPEAPAALPPSIGQALRRVLARLVSDSGFAPAPALGLRSGAAGVRQLLFAAEGRDIDLHVAPAADGAAGWQLSGQVLGPDLHGEVHLTGPGPEARAALDELAEFRFGPLAPGRWQLSLLAGELQIELPAFELPAAGA